VKLEERHANFQLPKRLGNEPHLLTGREEHQNFILSMAFQEGEEAVQLILDLNDHVILAELVWNFEAVRMLWLSQLPLREARLACRAALYTSEVRQQDVLWRLQGQPPEVMDLLA